ncbi:MAG: hypothetical protein AB7P69_19925 [Candidatus Binatia bacterium]
MKRRIHLKAVKGQFLLAVLIVSVAGYVGVQFLTSDKVESPLLPPFSQTTAMNTSEATYPDKGLPSAPVWQVYKDPKTGQFRRPPAGAFSGEELLTEPTVDEDTTRAPDMQEPREFMSPVLGGGVVTKVRLRFRRPLVATRDAEGNLKIQHMPQEADLNGE